MARELLKRSSSYKLFQRAKGFEEYCSFEYQRDNGTVQTIANSLLETTATGPEVYHGLEIGVFYALTAESRQPDTTLSVVNNGAFQ